ncbi:FKBP-type peptidyl-prolyl cis-trans isomerase [Flavobacteriales bacterium]|nr:FKBP-type peptidyl-prolyl cis-trans isomerase [Flavobacteriales bacterium]
MRKTIILGSAIAIALVSCGEKKSAPVALNNEIDSLSYAVGVILAENAKQMKEADSLNNSLITAGFENIINDNAPKMRMESAQKFAQNYFMNAEKKKFGTNLEEGQAFMDAFSKQKGVISTDSGILYKYINKSNSIEQVNPMGKVKCNYAGTFTDGQQFDASQAPVEFGVRQVIPGWTELLMLMHPGDKIKAVIPYEMAYGERGRNGIPPYSTLVFEMELVEIVK